MSQLVFPSSIPGLRISISRAPSYSVSTVMTQSRKRLSSTWETYPLYTYMLDFELLRSASTLREFQQLFGHYARHFGGLDSFLFGDPEDSAASDCGFAVGDAATTAFQLQRSMAGAVIDASGTQYTTQTKPYRNLITNSSFETDSNADGLADDWLDYNNTSALEPTTHVIVPGVNGGKAQRTSWGTNATNTKGVQQSAWTPITGQWYTVSLFARAFGSNIGQRIGMGWNNSPSQVLVINNPVLTSNWQRYVFQLFWNVGATTGAGLFLTITSSTLGASTPATGTFGDLDYDLVQMSTGQFGLADLQPIETPAGAPSTRTPVYWPGVSDGFEPVFDLNGDATIYQDGDWQGRRTLFPYPRTNLVNNSEQADLWTALNATVTANTSTAPDGTATADTFNEGAAVTVQHRINTTGSPADIAGELRCWSVFVKAGTLPNINIAVVGAFSTFVNFNLGTGAIDGVSGGVLASGVQTSPLWPGWSRVWLVRRGSATGTAIFVSGCLDNTYSSAGYTGTSRTFLIWGAMGERVSNINGPTPYVKSPGAANTTVTDYTLSSSGVVTLPAAPPAASFLSWDGGYYRRVRFDIDSIDATRIVQTFWEARSIRLISVKP